MSEELFKFQKELDDLTNLNMGVLRKITDSLADFEQTFKFLDVKKKTFLAIIIKEIFASNPKISTAKAEIIALASNQYIEFLEAYKDALKSYTEFKYKYETITNRIEILRSFISLEKEKLSLR